MFIERTPLFSNPNFFSKSRENSVCKSTNIFQKILSALLTIHYKIQTSIYSLRESRRGISEQRDRIFGKQILVVTSNRAKNSDLGTIASFKFNPHKIDDRIKNLVASKGFTPRQEVYLTPQPIDQGKCHGGTTLFLKEWLISGDIKTTAAQFQGGIPLEGILHHEVYQSSLFLDAKQYSSENVTELLIDQIEKRPSDEEFAQGILHMQNIGFSESSLRTFKAVQAFVNEGKNPAVDHLIDYVETWIDTHYHEKLTSLDRASLAHTVGFFRGECGKSMHEETALNIEGLKTEKALVVDAGQQQILEQAANLDPGAYKIGFPTYLPNGEKNGNHVIGLVIDEHSNAYLYDPNFAIGTITSDEIASSLSKLFKEYNTTSTISNGFSLSKINLIQN